MYSRVYVEITNRCNRSCSFCPGTNRPLGLMTPEQFRTVAQQLVGLTPLVYYHLMGEPLIHPELGALLEISSQLGLRSAITTNGTLLPSRGDVLIAAGVYKVNISIHSFEQGQEDAYLRYIQGCVDFAARAADAGVLVVLRLWNEGHDEGRNADTVALLRRAFPEPWQVGPRGTRLRQKVYLEYGQRFEWPDLEAQDRGNRVFCYGLRDHFGVLWDGTVVPCCLDHEGDLALGNLFTQPLTQILNSERAISIHRGFSNRNAPEELCRKCGYARRFD